MRVAVRVIIPETATISQLRSVIKTESPKLFENVDALKIRLCTVPEGYEFSACSKTLPLLNLHGLLKFRIAFTNLNNEDVVHALIEPPTAKYRRLPKVDRPQEVDRGPNPCSISVNI